MTSEQRDVLLDKFIKDIGATAIMIAFRVGDDLQGRIDGVPFELNAMHGYFSERMYNINKNAVPTKKHGK